MAPALQTFRSFKGFRIHKHSSPSSRPWPHLPVEILTIIVQCLQNFTADLYSLTLCSRVFHQITITFLYQHVSLTSKRRAESFFSTISLHPELRMCIRTFRTAWERSRDVSLANNVFPTLIPKPDTGTPLSRWLRHSQKTKDALLRKQTDFLELLPPNLRSLAVGAVLNGYGAGAGLTSVLQRLSLTKLSLTINKHNAKGLVSVLKSQPSLKHLELPWMFYITPLLPTDLPLLETFVGESMVAMRILPGRPIKRLTLLNKIFDTSVVLPYLTSGSDNRLQLEELSLHETRSSLLHVLGPTDFMRVISSTTPNLRSLNICVTFTEEGGRPSDMFKNFLESMPRHIGRMPNLEYLSLAKTRIIVRKRLGLRRPFFRPAPVKRPDLNDDLVVQHLLNTWGASCPTLNQVVMPDLNLWRSSQNGMWRKCGQQVMHPDESTIFNVL